MGNAAQLAQGGLQSQQQAMFDAQAQAMASSAGGGRSKKEISFAPQMTSGDMPTPMSGQSAPSTSAGPSMDKKVPGQAPKPSSAAPTQKTSTAGAPGTKRPPGQLKKADSTVGQKAPQKKTSVAGGPTPGRKASTAAPAGKSASRTGGQDDGALGKVLKKIVE